MIATYAWVAANAALTFGLTLVVAGLAAWYFQSQRNASAAGRMEKSQADLEGQVADTKTGIEKLTDKLKDLETVQNRLAGITGDVSQADRDHRRAVLGLSDAQDEYNLKVGEREKIEKALTQVSQIAAETGLPEAEVRKQLTAQLTEAKDEETRAHLDFEDAQAREQTTLATLNGLLAERVSLIEKENKLLAARPRLLDEIATAQQDLIMAPLGPGQIEGKRQQVTAAGAQQWLTTPGATTTITLQNAYFTVSNGQTVTGVLEDFAARSQSKNRVQSGIRT